MNALLAMLHILGLAVVFAAIAIVATQIISQVHNKRLMRKFNLLHIGDRVISKLDAEDPYTNNRENSWVVLDKRLSDSNEPYVSLGTTFSKTSMKFSSLLRNYVPYEEKE